MNPVHCSSLVRSSAGCIPLIISIQKRGSGLSCTVFVSDIDNWIYKSMRF